MESTIPAQLVVAKSADSGKLGQPGLVTGMGETGRVEWVIRTRWD